MAKKKKKKRRGKFNAKGCRYKGIWYDSTAEKNYSIFLEHLVEIGQLKSYVPHPPSCQLGPDVKWKIDFIVTDNDDKEFYVEYKGLATASYRIKLKVYKKYKPKPLIVVKQLKVGVEYGILAEVDTEALNSTVTHILKKKQTPAT